MDFAYPVSARERGELFQQVLALGEVQQWLELLGSRHVHGSKNTDAENPMARMFEFGLRRGYEALDRKMLKYAENLHDLHPSWTPPEVAFLIALGYSDLPQVREVFNYRLQRMLRTAEAESYDLFLSSDETKALPKAWQGKRIYKAEYTDPEAPMALPSIYDLIAMSAWTGEARDMEAMEKVVCYICDPRFQAISEAYAWDRQKRRCYSAGRAYLAILTPCRRILFLERLARFQAGREADIFQESMQELEVYKKAEGRYEFPSSFLMEKEAYYAYSGAHMGLGENRKQARWREIESTFRMANITRLKHLEGRSTCDMILVK
jgi:hypothetical protein